MSKKRIQSAIISLSIFILLVIAAILHSDYINHPPQIKSISPPATFPDETLTIKGENFGEKRGESDVFIAGIHVTSSHFISWKDSEIQLRVPYRVKSGRVYVHTEQGKSNGVLFTNKAHIPVILSGPQEPGRPHIESVSPEKGSVGTEVTIEGRNFGRKRGNGKVYFHFLLSGSVGASEDKDGGKFIACSERDFDYIAWSNRKIRVHVPDGAVSGNMRVETDRGKSNSVYFEVAKPVGAKRFEQVKGFQLQHDVRISGLESGEDGNGVEVWIPRPVEGYAQQNVKANHEPEPMWKDYRGVMRYHVTAGEKWDEKLLSHTYWLDRYSILTDVDAGSVRWNYDEERELVRHYTASGSMIPSGNEYIRNLAQRITRGYRNPYAKASTLYNYLIEELEVDSSAGKNIQEALETGKCPSHLYGMVFVSLARAVEIPARPVAGYIVHGDKLTRRHVWAEFYIPEFGWIPTDPALGDGIGYITMPVEEPEQFYFGNLENQHITFTRHVVEIPKVNPHSRSRNIYPPFALQTVWEEYLPELEGYRSVWKDISIIDWW